MTEKDTYGQPMPGRMDRRQVVKWLAIGVGGGVAASAVGGAIVGPDIARRVDGTEESDGDKIARLEKESAAKDALLDLLLQGMADIAIRASGTADSTSRSLEEVASREVGSIGIVHGWMSESTDIEGGINNVVVKNGEVKAVSTSLLGAQQDVDVAATTLATHIPPTQSSAIDMIRNSSPVGKGVAEAVETHLDDGGIKLVAARVLAERIADALAKARTNVLGSIIDQGGRVIQDGKDASNLAQTSTKALGSFSGELTDLLNTGLERKQEIEQAYPHISLPQK